MNLNSLDTAQHASPTGPLTRRNLTASTNWGSDQGEQEYGPPPMPMPKEAQERLDAALSELFREAERLGREAAAA